MHEASIIQALKEQVAPLVPAGSTLRGVRIEVGQLEHLDRVVMETVWTALTENTDLAVAELHIEYTQMRIRCKACGNEYTPEDVVYLVCPACEAVQPEVLQGTGILLRSLTVDEPVIETETQ